MVTYSVRRELNEVSCRNLKLSVPIEMGTETVPVLEFRKPSVGDIRRIGYPIFLLQKAI